MPVTFTVMVQLLLAAIVPPVSDRAPDPATAVAVPPQVLVKPLGVATTKPVGSVSVNATPVALVSPMFPRNLGFGRHSDRLILDDRDFVTGVLAPDDGQLGILECVDIARDIESDRAIRKQEQ